MCLGSLCHCHHLETSNRWAIFGKVRKHLIRRPPALEPADELGLGRHVCVWDLCPIDFCPFPL